MMIGVPPGERLEAAWAEAAPILARAIAEGDGELEPGDLRRLLDEKAAQLWLWLDAGGEVLGACVTSIDRHPRQAVCSVWLGAAAVDGRRGEWLSGLGVIERWARLQGCAAVEIRGRRGWLRVLDGYREKRTILRKDISR